MERYCFGTPDRDWVVIAIGTLKGHGNWMYYLSQAERFNSPKSSTFLRKLNPLYQETSELIDKGWDTTLKNDHLRLHLFLKTVSPHTFSFLCKFLNVVCHDLMFQLQLRADEEPPLCSVLFTGISAS